jgi:hypothetical protein
MGLQKAWEISSGRLARLRVRRILFERAMAELAVADTALFGWSGRRFDFRGIESG